jgi:hypothetical protein
LEHIADNNFKVFGSVWHDCWIPLKKISANNLKSPGKLVMNNSTDEYSQMIRHEIATMYENGNNYINKENLLLELKSGYNIQNSDLIYCRIPNRRTFVKCSKFEM